ncbi:glycosyltransferase family 2 protein [uncultured Pseudokineococcus sp.]|uniref:glycosyltransferase n=1 Tax=uncultured Pseudokineococcus sp. TaxID=1642928 RepID=UPI00261CD89D|nr:glycosyltransferase family 2 protein [uncultured Pseudokineococcus sp.]
MSRVRGTRSLGVLPRAGRGLVAATSAVSTALLAHTCANALLLRRPAADPPPVRGAVSVLLPVRDEAHQVAACLAAVRAQRGVPDLEVLVLDDASGDGTAEAARAAADGDPRVRVLAGRPAPAGWLGKTWACAQLAEAAGGDVLVFVDADVRLAIGAVAAAVDQLRRSGLDLVSPYPRQVAVTPGERLVQPLLQWSWLATLPLRLAERSPRPSLSAANGQLLVVDAARYRAAGGHAAVRGDVLDDVALVRAVKAAGGRGGVTDGTALATCRMYDGWPAVRDGYAKSLWSAGGSPGRSLVLAAGLAALGVAPLAGALAGSRAGALGLAAGVASRVVAARRTGGRAWPDAAAHPASLVVLAALVVRSVRGHRRGDLEWKGRRLPSPPHGRGR